MAAERVRPQYGEYASPEDQARASGATDVRRPPTSEEAPERVAPPATTTLPETAPPAAVRPARRWDTAASLLLLAYGLLAVVLGAAQYADLAGLVGDVFETQGIGAFTSDARADAFGAAINIVNVVLYVIVFAITVGLLRARRLAFYVPLAGGVLSAIVAFALLAVVMVGDPAFQEYVRSSPNP